MKALVTNISAELWYEAAESLRLRVEELKRVFRCDEVAVSWNESGIEKSPCTTQLWRRDVATEHDEYTFYFKHWFKKTLDGKLQVCRFSHLALMPLVRACVWQGLLAEFVTGRLLNRDAVRLRVESELEQYSNLTSPDQIKKIGMLAQDFFGLVKNHLGATWRPLNRAGLGAAERIVVNLPGYDCRSARKGWTNRKLRKILAQRIVDAGIADIPTRKEQEAFIWRWLGCEQDLKQSAAGAILKILCNYFDGETGEVVIKPWKKEELAEIRREARLRGTMEQVMARADAIRQKIKRGVALTGAERYFKCKHKEFFEDLPKNGKNQPKETAKNKFKNVREQNAKRKISIVTNQLLFPNTNNPTTQPKRNPKSNHLFPSGTYGDFGLMHNKEGKK